MAPAPEIGNQWPDHCCGKECQPPCHTHYAFLDPYFRSEKEVLKQVAPNFKDSFGRTLISAQPLFDMATHPAVNSQYFVDPFGHIMDRAPWDSDNLAKVWRLVYIQDETVQPAKD